MARVTFANDRGVTPMLWVFSALAVIEMIVMHLFVALKWPWIGWPLTALSALSVGWLVLWIRSWRRLPHELEDDVLTLHMGSLRSVRLPLSHIAAVTPSMADLRAPGTRNLVPIAYPNRMIVLAAPSAGRRPAGRYAVRIDDAAAFDAALAAAGVSVET